MPASAHHFVPVWHSREAEQTYRSTHYAPPLRKRKRDQSPLDSDDEDKDDQSESSHATFSRVSQRPDELKRDPYHVAGQTRGTPLPPAPFPHAAVKLPPHERYPKSIQRQLAALKPPLYVPPQDDGEDDQPTSLRRHHLNVMTTIMHSSLLKGDFVRAGRAWGMILRTEIKGSAIDVRMHGRWGIGAEILLRKHQLPTKAPLQSGGEDSIPDIDADDEVEDTAVNIAEDGFAQAKTYYEHLIRQYPYQRTHPNSTSALTFYPTMFGLCIFEIQESSKRALREASKNASNSSPTPYDSDEPDEIEDGDDATPKEPKEVVAVRIATLDKAMELAGKMDDLMLSPPYDTHVPLVQLRAMVARWLVDLCQNVRGADREKAITYRMRLSSEQEIATRCAARLKARGVDLPDFVGIDVSTD